MIDYTSFKTENIEIINNTFSIIKDTAILNEKNGILNLKIVTNIKEGKGKTLC